MTVYRGGFGGGPWGRSEMGNPKCDIEPRFLQSKPIDGSTNVATNVWLKFTTYCYSSWIDLADITVEISEDGGTTYADAYASSSFVSPYDATNSKVRRPDSHSICFWIFKSGLWASNETILVRFTGTDEYGNTSTKEAPVVWG